MDSDKKLYQLVMLTTLIIMMMTDAAMMPVGHQVQHVDSIVGKIQSLNHGFQDGGSSGHSALLSLTKIIAGVLHSLELTSPTH